ncbi:hypothetical protein RUM44_003614 [Polyplax serrata]|uniref:Probable RNA polymerase II nuclear localization protein SLC7A6OS n=1 Tax=Polyplax serrata TaxID=468196 RepID=A0ABR1AGZ1_POLSC
MTTIIRVKRHRGEDPVEALVLSCKRKKTENSSSDTDSNLFKYVLNFSGTVEEKDDKIAASTVESFKNDSKYSDFKNKEHTPDIKTKQRKEWKERSDDSRFTLLSCLRSGNSLEKRSDAESQVDGQMNITIVDVRKEKSEEEPAATENAYVYDLYYTNVECDPDYSDMFMEHLLSVQPLQTDLDFRNGEDCFDEVDPDEDDSNDENNWRNDYPDSDVYVDEDDNEDEEDDYLSRQLNKFHFGTEDSGKSSSDSGDERYLNYDDDEKYLYYEENDFHRSYATYKAKAIKELGLSKDGDDDDDDDDAELNYSTSTDDEEYSDCRDY